jgi:hypothetical protein
LAGSTTWKNERAELVEQTLEDLRGTQGNGNTDAECWNQQKNASAQNHRQYHAGLRPKGETDAELARTARYRVRKQAADSDAGEENSNGSEEARQPGDSAISSQWSRLPALPRYQRC